MSDIDDLRRRAAKLAKEKSKLQMVSDVLIDLAAVRGLSELVSHSLTIIMDVWGGSNVTLIYIMDEQWYQCDVYDELKKVDAIEDPDIQKVLHTGLFVECAKDTDIPVLEDEFGFTGQKKTWIYPIKTKDETFGAISIEGVFLNENESIKETLGIIINYISMLLRNEILSASDILLTNQALKKEIKERKEEERRYRDTIESSFDGFWRIDLKGRFLEVNEIYCTMTGYSEAELLSMHVSDVEQMESPQEIEQHIKRLIATGRDRFESRHRCKNGRIVDIEVNAIYTDYKGGMLYAFLRDISDKKRAEKERLHLEEQFHQSQKVESIGRLAGGVAHDLNNLLSPILGYSELLISSFSEGDPRKMEAGYILEAGKRARDLIKQLLAFSRKQSLEYQLINLNNVILGFESLLRRTMREDIHFRLKLAPGLGNVKADTGQIEQVLMNLCVNAQDAMPEGGDLVIETKMVSLEKQDSDTLESLPPGEYVVLTLSDTGIGMSQNVMDNIFEPFYSTKGEFGTGLGLATVSGIISQHGGDIRVSSSLNQGSSFHIYLPVSSETSVPVKIDLLEEDKETCKDSTILLVEDNDIVRKLAQEILLKNDYKVLCASNGMEALNILEEPECSVELLLTDVIMPRMNGRELYNNAIKIHPDLKVIFMSGYMGEATLLGDLDETKYGFIHKPFTLKNLLDEISSVSNS